MTWPATFHKLPPRQRGILVALAAILVLAGVALTISRTRGDRQGDAGPDEMSGMHEMDMGGDGAVHLTSDQIGQFGITFGTVDDRTLSVDVRTVGLVTFDETRVAHVTPKVSGFAQRLYVNYTGQPVRRGQPLVDVYSPELVAAQEELLLAVRLLGATAGSTIPGMPAGSGEGELLAAARRRLRLWDISDAQIDAILRSGEVRTALTLHAPTHGVVVEKNVIEGQSIAAGKPLYTIADLRRVWIEAELRESQAASVSVGTVADIQVSSYPGTTFKGMVEFIHPTLDSQARTVKARVAVSNAEGRLKPGMYATVRLHTPARRTLTVPTASVVRTGERSIVFVDFGNGRLVPQEIEPGVTLRDYTEVLAGLEPGQRVVTSAQFILDSESNLAEVMRAMIGQMGTADMGNMEMGGMQPPERR